MSKYQVLARKYRPQYFKDVVGQEAIVTTLKNAIQMERTAHAYLFCGSRGTGKTSLARLFAKALNCLSPSKEGECCNACPSCKDIAAGHSIDVLEIDGASHRGIEDIRQINDSVGFTPTTGAFKVYLIDEVHMLTKEAFNALLKTLEEPPSHVKFFFATTEPHKIPATILSRCQRFNLGRIACENICSKLKQIAHDLKLEIKEDVYLTLAELSEGSMRDAESLFDQVIAYQQTPITKETVDEILGIPSRNILFEIDKAGHENEYVAAFRITQDIFSSGKNTAFFLEELLQHFRALFLLKNGVLPSGRDQKKYAHSVEYYRIDQLLDILELLTDAQQNLKFALSEKTALEMLILKILRSHQRLSIDQLVGKLEKLEARVGQPLSSPAPISKAPPKPKKIEPKPPINIKEQARFDTLMRFAAKELSGSFKKE